MQYKIPVQIENEDKLFLNLSLRQITIIMIGFGISYSMFKNIEPNFGGQVALIPSGVVAFIALFIALFRSSEMTFLPFLLNFIRLNLNSKLRFWGKGVDSYSNLDIGYLTSYSYKPATEFKSKEGVYESLEEKLNKI